MFPRAPSAMMLYQDQFIVILAPPDELNFHNKTGNAPKKNDNPRRQICLNP